MTEPSIAQRLWRHGMLGLGLLGALCAAVLLIGALGGCGDPGSGGSGTPTGAGNPAPAGNGVGAPPAADAPAPGGEADLRAFGGVVSALDAQSLTVAGRRIDTQSARFAFSDGADATRADLRVGQRVSVELVASPPGPPDTADRVIIDIATR